MRRLSQLEPPRAQAPRTAPAATETNADGSFPAPGRLVAESFASTQRAPLPPPSFFQTARALQVVHDELAGRERLPRGRLRHHQHDLIGSCSSPKR